MMCFEVVIMVSLEESLDLLCEKGEKFLGCFCGHEIFWYGDFGLRQGKGRIPVKLN